MATREWQATDFLEFREDVESIFGPLEELEKNAPDIYAHFVCSHGFMKYNRITNVVARVKKQIIKERIEAGDERYKEEFEKYLDQEDFPTEIHQILYRENKGRFYEIEKQEYDKWAEENNIVEELRELGWETFRDD